nr:MAG TPA: hypothetical protein [Caudoviricetes sp.]
MRSQTKTASRNLQNRNESKLTVLQCSAEIYYEKCREYDEGQNKSS